ncbi:MAG: hypothetical protein NC133_00475 [Prevotella sp.]|nr:hypothetical protein [Prevotella sp.]
MVMSDGVITGWFNYLGLVFVVLLLLPNLIYAIKNQDQPQPPNKIASIMEQIGRYGVMFTMVFNLPPTVFGFYLSTGPIIYVVLNTILIVAYWLVWLIFSKHQSLARTLLLSTIPSVLFLVAGILIASILLILCALVFAVFHVFISLQNYRQEQQHGLQ